MPIKSIKNIKLKHFRLKSGSNFCLCVTILRLGLLLQLDKMLQNQTPFR